MNPKPAGRSHDDAYLAWVRSLPCLFLGQHVCLPPVESHHTAPRPMGRKCDDRKAVPLCRKAHRDWEHASGVFRTMDKLDRRAWATRAIAATQLRYDRHIIMCTFPGDACRCGEVAVGGDVGGNA